MKLLERRRKERQSSTAPVEPLTAPVVDNRATVIVGDREIPVPERQEELFQWAAQNPVGQQYLEKYARAKAAADVFRQYFKTTELDEVAEGWLEVLKTIAPTV